MQRRTASDRVRAARANIRLAAQTCGTADIASLQRSLNLLEIAALEMRRAETDVHSGMLKDTGELQLEIAKLKREIAGLMRVIDGCAALCRGLSVRLGGTAVAYTPQGRPVASPPAGAACELRG
jgi:hypothetical protein